MSDGSEPQTPFTFRVAYDEIHRIGSQLSGLTNQARTPSNAKSNTQFSVHKKRKELRELLRKIGSKKKTLEKLKKTDQGSYFNLFTLVLCRAKLPNSAVVDRERG